MAVRPASVEGIGDEPSAGGPWVEAREMLQSERSTIAPLGANADQFDRLTGPAVVRDEAGRPLGYFLPARSEESLLALEMAVHRDAEDIARRKASSGTGRSTSEVLERLRSLEQP
jgi:hypothetical protein